MNDQTTALQKTDQDFSAFGSEPQFVAAQRMALAICTSTIVPEPYRGKDKLGDVLIALEISNRIGATVLAVMQNLYVVHGKPAWSSQFLISCVNASRKFTPIRYKTTGEKGTDTWGKIAWAKDQSGEVLESPEVTIGMAKAEGWYGKNGSKWKTMPELMLCYRAATLFARLYAPELTMGIQTAEEIVDIVDDKPRVTTPIFKPALPVIAPVPPLPEQTLTDKVQQLLGTIPDESLIDYMLTTGRVKDDSLTTLADVERMEPDALRSVIADWPTIGKELAK